MDEIIALLESKITLETSCNMTSEQQHYIAGLSDAVQIIRDYMRSQIAIGKQYYVITHIGMEAKVEKMTLYRINKKNKNAYCFTKNENEPMPDLVLYSKNGLKMRVFNDYESAEKNIPLFLYSLEERERRYGKKRY